MRYILLIISLLATSFVAKADYDIESLLRQLDSQIEQREAYLANRLQRIASLMELRGEEGMVDERLYSINERLIEEYITFQADSAIYYYQQNLTLAKRLGDEALTDKTSIDLAHFYASTGFYYEASQLLASVDVESLSEGLTLDYYISQHKLNDELSLYSNDEVQRERSLQLAYHYNTEILRITELGSYEARNAEMWLAIQREDYVNADGYAQMMMEQVSEFSREWATLAFMRGLVASRMGNQEGHMVWMIRSAIVDMRLGLRDYAALKSIAAYCTNNYIERSMRYMRVMMEDVQAFNSRLRPWQDAMIWPEIEKGYHAYTKRVAAEQLRYIYMLCILVGVVILLFIWSVLQNSRLRDARHKTHEANERLNSSVEELREANERLTELNAQIGEANGVKEEYIGIFLQVCSEYIDKMVGERRRILKALRDGKSAEIRKELDGPSLESVELKQFYNLFDSTFLRLYPTFVEELNALLAEDSRFELKKGEYLNTELRIFALIRLGISDTPRIASLLHYSLSTIYNYRSRIRYNEGITREEFEKRIRTIGSFNK